MVPNPFRCVRFPCRVVRQVGDRPIGQASEVHRAVEARELDRVQQIEDVEPDLELHPLRHREVFRDRQVDIVERRVTGEEPRCFVAIAARLRRREARRVGELPVRIAAVTHAGVARQDDPRVRIAVGAGQVRGADAGDREVDRIRPAARPPVDARELPVVRQDTQSLVARHGRCLVDGVDREVVRPVVVQQPVVERPGLLVAQIRHAGG